MSEPFIGEIRIFGFNFPPYGWAFCDGSLVAIQHNSALFSILGTTFGGNGTSTFALPDLRGRAPMHWGDGPALTPRVIGESFGEDSVTLLQTEIPAHTHQLQGALPGDAASQLVGTPTALANFSINPMSNAYQATLSPPVPFSPRAIGITGGSQPHANNQPRSSLNFCIALQGIFPSRN